ncbi:ORF6C domain-containing protein [Clostridium botulinum]|uniref:Phage anti-repressor protein n=1 Tax=Clostridium botulinum TaxID=1491 RepID=A0A9Q1UYL9_CLOBO|nr:ORF6C domain-containing protein [Clostridium botulinum]AEB75868.1 phage protein [Clostridium botulinum BKT015925]KEI04706.1 hypothetical protein Y848_00660 [Clostridium botulinum C/D str. Sp77]KLU76924.1 hypothetical protein CBC3_01065 [Clostridium botulinum V891]KOA75229.1 hypothetical protein ADU78_08560 [Clostridium botulinum]KOA79009.1 hypothetical protein ADU77_04980 [Clostridium botulinum]
MNNLEIIEIKGRRVLTTEQLAKIYGTTTDNIKVNFNNHKNNFKEGKHYYFLQGKELKEFKNQVNDIYLVGKRAASLYLWTERGANRHCKILDTDKAWEQFDNLEEIYFRVKEDSQNVPKTLEDIMICTLQGMKEVKQQLNQVNNHALEAKEGVRKLREESPLFGVEMDELQKSVRGKGIKVLGGYHTNAYNDKSLRTKVYSDIQRELKRQFGVSSYKAIKRKEFQHSLEMISKYKPPFVLQNEIEYINNQIVLQEVACSR